MAKKPSEGNLLYHITHIDNVQSILNNGLLSRKNLNENLKAYIDIADPQIISSRDCYKESLSKYVLFHFFAKNPFDYAVSHKYGSENLVIITINRNLAQKNDFKIIPSHPLDSDIPDILPYQEGFKKIKWDILDNAMNRDYSNPEIKKACMAECVMEYIVQPEVFAYIYVKTEKAKNKILEMDNAHKVKISVNQNMFL